MGAVIVLASALAPRLLEFGMIVAVAGIGVLAYPVFGLYLMLAFFIAQGSPLYTQYGIFSGAYTLSDAVGLLVLIGYLMQSLRPNRERALAPLRGRGGLAVAVVFAYFLWSALTSIWSPAALGDLLYSYRNDVEHVCLFALSILLLTDLRKVRGAAGAYALTGAGLAVYTILTFRGNHGFDATSLSSQAYRGGLPSTFNANELGIILAVVPAFTAMSVAAMRRGVRVLAMAAVIPITGLALIILTSRGTFVALGVAILVALAASQGYRRRLALVPIVLLGAATFAVLSATGHLPAYFQDRFTQAQYDQAGDRIPVWTLGLQQFADHPLGGIGEQGFETILPSSHIVGSSTTSAHNDFVRTLADFGIVGFGFLVLMITVLGYVAVVDSGRDPAGIVVAVALAVSMLSGTFLQAHWMWAALSIACAFGLVVSRSRPVGTAVHGKLLVGTTALPQDTGIHRSDVPIFYHRGPASG